MSQNEIAKSFCGTAEYLAPEMLDGTGHHYGIDWWALGTLIYEMIVGITPFYHKNREHMFMLIKEATIKFPDHKLHGIYVSPEAQDLINKLLDKNMETRLGSDGGVDQIMAHDFFKGLDIQKLLNKEIKAPFKPVIDSLTSNFDESVTGMDPRESIISDDQRRIILKKVQSFQFDFDEFNNSY